MRLLTLFFISISLGVAPCLAVGKRITFIPMPSKEADVASRALLKQTRNISVSKALRLSEPFFSPQDYEKLLKMAHKTGKHKISKVTHYKDGSFEIQSDPYKLTFKWIDKNKVAFELNGQAFSFEEAANPDIWYKKVGQVVKNSSKNPSFPKGKGAFLFLQSVFGIPSAQAFFDLGESSTALWVGLAVFAIGLIVHNMYKKHKEEHEKNKAKVLKALAQAKRSREAAVKLLGSTNLTSHDKKIADLETLNDEYNGPQNDVGFFGYLFFQRITKPARYDRVMREHGGDGTAE